MSRRTREAPDLEAMLKRMIRALVSRCATGELEALEALQRLSGAMGQGLHDGARAYRSSPAQPSWTDMGRILGVSRQAACQRFGGPDERP